MRPTLVVLGTALLVFVLIEILGLVFIYASIPRYSIYWKKRVRQQGDITYVALGDSAAQGVGASRASHSYVGVLAQRMEDASGQTVQVINLSKSGARVGDVLRDQLPLLEKVPNPDVVTIEIGANDVQDLDEAKFEAEFKELAERLPPKTYISDLPAFSDGPDQKNQRRAAAIARKVIATRSDLQLVPLEYHTSRYFHDWRHSSFDFFHPNNAGYRVWADAFWIEMNPQHTEESRRE